MLTTVPEIAAPMACIPAGSGVSSGDGPMFMSRLPWDRIASGSGGSVLAAGTTAFDGSPYSRGCSPGAHSDSRCSPMNPVCQCPAAKSGAASRFKRNSRLLATPVMRNSANARRAFAVTACKSPDVMCTMTLASSESKRGLTRVPAWPLVSTRTPGPDGGSKASNVPADGRTTPSDDIVSALTRTCIAMPRGNPTSLAFKPSSAKLRPAARSSCARTRSIPVTSSVTVCSTCRRGLASINTNEECSVASCSTRNSNVARLSSFTSLAMRSDASIRRSRNAADKPGAGAISTSFCRLRCRLHSRSHRWVTAPLPSPMT